ncbi:MAG: AMP-binding protein [Burkholderiaceae bacterium]|jgi:acyl-CoA synthetase (AMP-forming)/AMP-acid ligase II|nr:AMP-binding protein [Burkholderiaceae bacterium]
MNHLPHPDTPAPSALDINLIERVCVGDIVQRSADVHPDRIAIVDGERQVSYAQFNLLVNRLGHALLGLGLQHQDIVALAARNSVELLVTYFACARAGLICMPINLGLRASEIAFCLNNAKARVLIAEQALRELIQPALAERPPELQHVFWFGGATVPAAEDFDALLAAGGTDALEVWVGDRDTVQLLYTSGTTANPKGALTSHLAVTMAGLSGAIASQSGPDSTALVALPLFHCAMLNSVAIPLLITGSKLVLAKGFDAALAARLIDQHQVTFTVLLPMMYGLWLSDPAYKGRTFPSMKRAMYAMAPMPHDRLQAIHDMFPNADVVLGSGQTEFTPATCMQRPEHQWSKSATWGTATAMTRVAIMGEDGRLLPRGETGEIVYRGPQGMTGYLNQPEETRQSFRGGWFHSGDVAHIDEDGAIWFKDRSKDVIKSGGENVTSIEVERCLMQHPAVAEAAVVGAPHEHWGEAVVASVVLAPGQSAGEAALIEHCREHLGSFKVPKAIVIATEFPRTGTGKIQKHLIRAKVREMFSSKA